MNFSRTMNYSNNRKKKQFSFGEDIDSKANRKKTNRVRDLWIGSLERTDFGDQNALIKS